jgi:hypothetical protein
MTAPHPGCSCNRLASECRQPAHDDVSVSFGGLRHFALIPGLGKRPLQRHLAKKFVEGLNHVSDYALVPDRDEALAIPERLNRRRPTARRRSLKGHDDSLHKGSGRGVTRSGCWLLVNHKSWSADLLRREDGDVKSPLQETNRDTIYRAPTKAGEQRPHSQ